MDPNDASSKRSSSSQLDARRQTPPPPPTTLTVEDLQNEVLRLQRRLGEKKRLQEKAAALGLEDTEGAG